MKIKRVVIHIHAPHGLGLAVLDWHGGQYYPSYAVGSSWYAGYSVDADTVEACAREFAELNTRLMSAQLEHVSQILYRASYQAEHLRKLAPPALRGPRNDLYFA